MKSVHKYFSVISDCKSLDKKFSILNNFGCRYATFFSIKKIFQTQRSKVMIVGLAEAK